MPGALVLLDRQLWASFLTGPELGLLSELSKAWHSAWWPWTRYFNWPTPTGTSIEQAQLACAYRELV